MARLGSGVRFTNMNKYISLNYWMYPEKYNLRHHRVFHNRLHQYTTHVHFTF